MSSDLERLAAAVRDEIGIELPEGRLPYLAEVARRRIAVAGSDGLADYIEALSRGSLRDEWEALASLLTIKESSFFRAPQQWEQLRSRLLPEIAAQRAADRRFRAWSAACANGEEPATLALVIAGMEIFAGWDWSILATDVDPEALAQAGRAHYGERALAAVPDAVRAERFRRRGTLWELDPSLRQRILLRRLNLAHSSWSLTEKSFDLVFLRNVLIYFRPELQRQVVARAVNYMAEDGWLFLGGSETLWRIHPELEAVDLGNCFAYRRKREHATARAALRPRTARVQSRASGGPAPEGAASRPPTALSAPAAAPSGQRPTAAERLIAAAALVEGECLAQAASEIEQALEEDPADPAAHTLAGLVAARKGELGTAADSFRAALYLEPKLAHVRLLLADCLHRLGEKAFARRQYREVLTTFESGTAFQLVALAGQLLPDAEEAVRRARDATLREVEGR